MLNLNRRYAKALEKSARADERLATAEESIARSVKEILRNPPDPQRAAKDRPFKNVTPSKPKPPGR
jgi:hypothetical protein